MKPLQITIRLTTPLALQHPWMHFDGLLAHLWLQRHLGRGFYELPGRRVVPFEFDLPLARTRNLWHASVSFLIPDVQPQVTTIYKRFHESRLAPQRLRRVARGTGHYKDYMLKLVLFPAQAVRFFAKGDPEAILDLLSDLRAIGFKRDIGWGAVGRIEVEEIDVDRSLVWSGIAMRPIPVRFLKAWDDAAVLTWKPPYWDRSQAELCAPPGARVEWDDGTEMA